MDLFGTTRTHVAARHALIAPDGHVASPLPGWTGAQGTVLVSPQLSAAGARFQQYLAVLQQDGAAAPPPAGIERFVFVLDGAARVRVADRDERLEPQGYAFLPAGTEHRIDADGPCRLHVFETRYVPLAGHDAPEPVLGDLPGAPSEPFLGDPHVRVRRLLPDDPSFDLAVNVMQFDPGAALPFVETHANEHGLFMLSGSGIYRLEDAWYPVKAGDAIWMGPYCPQWFGALGSAESGYLLYKDQNRDWLDAADAR